MPRKAKTALYNSDFNNSDINFEDSELNLEIDEDTLNDLKKIFEQALKEKKDGLEPKLVREIVPASKWVDDVYYTGLEGEFVYPYWKDLLVDIFETNKGKYSEVILTGGIGTGKTTAAVFLLIRKLYELSCYEHINALFKLMPSSIIAFAFITVSRTQAEMTSYGQFKSWVDNIPYFKENFPRSEKINSLMLFPENVTGLPGSNPSHVIGMNMISCLLDEANFFQKDAQASDKSLANYDKVSRMYMAILNRANSRFLLQGQNHSLCILVSSNTNASSFTEQRIDAVLKEGKNGHTKIVNARVWEVKPKGTYSDEYFWVFVGSNMIDPIIVESVSDVDMFLASFNQEINNKNINDLDLKIAGLPEHLKKFFMRVPIDFLTAFKNDIYMALQDVAGISIVGNDKFFTNREAYTAMADDTYKHPFIKDEFVISTGDSVEIKDYLRKDWVPPDENRPRFIHVDQSLVNDATGFSTAYIKDWVKVNNIYLPIIAVDLKLRIVPPKPPRQISIQKVVNFILFLRDEFGLEIGYITYDQFQSQMALQTLADNGFNVGYQSVDKSPSEAYYAYANLLYEGRLKSYEYIKEKNELFELIAFREIGKVDHPSAGSKDVCDSVVGSVYNALKAAGDLSPNSDFHDLTLKANSVGDGSESELFTAQELAEVLGNRNKYQDFDVFNNSDFDNYF